MYRNNKAYIQDEIFRMIFKLLFFWFILCLFVLPVQAQTCGRFTCRPELNGTCEDSECQCSETQLGDASMDCVDPNDRCVCTFNGDSKLITFSNQQLLQPLPCAQLIASAFDMTPSSYCILIVAGVNNYREWLNSNTSFENILEIFVHANDSDDWVIIRRGDGPVNETNNSNATLITTTTTDNIKSIDVPFCRSVIKYDVLNAAFTVSVPNTFHMNGAGNICSHCGNRLLERTHIDAFEALSLQLSSLRRQSLVDQTDLNNYDSCRAIYDASISCRNREAALRLCGSLLVIPELRTCLQGELNSSVAMLDNFKDCYEATCQAQGKRPCSEFVEYFKGCDSGLLQNSTLCLQ